MTGIRKLTQWLIAAVLVLSGTVLGADKALEDVFARYIKLGEELAPVLAAAKDATSAEKAASALKDMLPRVIDTGREIKAISSLNAEETKELLAKFEKPMRTAWGKVFDEIYRLQKTQCYGSVSFFSPFSILCSLLEE